MTIDTATACAELQEQELLVLESIYPDNFTWPSINGEFKLEIVVELDPAAQVDIFASVTAHATTTLRLSALPPVLICLLRPPEYPLHSPPRILSISSTHSWLPSGILPQVQKCLQDLWDGQNGVLYEYLEWIRSGDILRELGLSKDGRSVVRIQHPAPNSLAPLLLEHNERRELELFANSAYTCSICMTSLKGSKCVPLCCKHVFCLDCLGSFWKLCIREGDVTRVGCPDPACVKVGAEVSEQDLCRVVNEDEVKRWKWLNLKRLAEKDPTMIHCPIESCQKLVPRPAEADDDDSGWSRFRACPSCSFTFCSFCKRTWHGPLAPCELITSTSIITAYMELSDSDPAKLLMERRYGKRNILRLVKIHEDERANEAFLESSTTCCPGCKVHVQKSMGCNHMTCSKCSAHFCFRCGETINPKSPYAHFSTRGHPCHNKLFDYQPEEDGWQPMEGFHLE